MNEVRGFRLSVRRLATELEVSKSGVFAQFVGAPVTAARRDGVSDTPIAEAHALREIRADIDPAALD